MSFIDKYKQYIVDPKNRTNVIIGSIIMGFMLIIIPGLLFLAILFLLIYFIVKNFKPIVKKNKSILSVNLIILIISLSLLGSTTISFEIFCVVFTLHLILNFVCCLILYFLNEKDKAKEFLLTFALVLLIGFSSCSAIMLSHF